MRRETQVQFQRHFQFTDDVLDALGHRGGKQFRLVIEVKVNGALAHAGLTGDLFHACLVEALLGKDRHRGQGDRGPLFFCLVLASAHAHPWFIVRKSFRFCE